MFVIYTSNVYNYNFYKIKAKTKEDFKRFCLYSPLSRKRIFSYHATTDADGDDYPYEVIHYLSGLDFSVKVECIQIRHMIWIPALCIEKYGYKKKAPLIISILSCISSFLGDCETSISSIQLSKEIEKYYSSPSNDFFLKKL